MKHDNLFRKETALTYFKAVDQDIFGGLSFVGQAQAEPYEERATPCCWTINLVLQQCLFCSPDFNDIMMVKPSGTLY